MFFSESQFNAKKLLAGLVICALFVAVGCGPVEDDAVSPTISAVNEQSGYPAQGYPAPGSSNGYPVPTTEVAFQEPPPILPSFPGKIAFQTERFNGSLQIALFDGATGNITQLNSTFAQSFEPTWAPDCSSLIYTVGQAGSTDFELHQQGVTDSEASLFVNHTNFYDWGADWSVANDVVAYQTNENALINICFADAAGNELGCMERSGFSNAMPAWSPDGSQLVFSSNRDENWELYLIDYPGLSSVTPLTDNAGTNFDPVFAPDGRTIVFSSQRGSAFNIYSIQPDGENEQQLTSDGADERYPVWVGNSLIVYSGGFQDETELFLMNGDGSNSQQLTYSPGRDEWPSWCAAP